MKTKKLIAFLATAALCTAIALPLSACGDKETTTTDANKLSGKQLNIADYMLDYNKASSYEVTGFKSVSKLNTVENESQLSAYVNSGVAVKTETDGNDIVYRLYNPSTGAYVNSEKYKIEPIINANHYIKITDEDGKISYIDYSGATIIAADNYKSITPTLLYNGSSLYIDGVEGAQKVVKFSIEKEGEKVSYKYFYEQYTQSDAKDATTKVYTGKLVEVAESKISVYSSYKKADDEDTVPYYEFFFTNNYDEESLTGDVINYSISRSWQDIEATQNATPSLIFYKDGEKSGELQFELLSNDLKNALNIYYNFPVLGAIGYDVYYLSAQLVSSTATEGYNFVDNSGTTEYKYNISYHKYNIISNETTDYKPEYLYTHLYGLVNNTTNESDAGLAYGYKFIDGIAYSNDLTYTMLLDSDGTASKDLTLVTAATNIVGSLYKLDDDHYALISSSITIFDKNFKSIVSGKTLYPESKLISVYESSSYQYFDYDGNEVISNDMISDSSSTSALIFYDGVALATSYTANRLGFENTKYFVTTDGAKKAINDYLKDENDDFAISPTSTKGYFVVKTTDTEATENQYTYKVYNFAGSVLLTAKGDGIRVEDTDTKGNVYFSITSTETVNETQTTVTTYYKLSK